MFSNDSTKILSCGFGLFWRWIFGFLRYWLRWGSSLLDKWRHLTALFTLVSWFEFGRSYLHSGTWFSSHSCVPLYWRLLGQRWWRAENSWVTLWTHDSSITLRTHDCCIALWTNNIWIIYGLWLDLELTLWPLIRPKHLFVDSFFAQLLGFELFLKIIWVSSLIDKCTF